MSRRHTKVFLALAWYEPGHLLGISRYACEKNWLISRCGIVTDDRHQQLARQIQGFQPHGIISQVQDNKPDIVRVVKAACVPVVELCWVSGMEVPRVVPDDEGMGSLAATHLLERGFTKFVFVGDSARPELQRGFARIVRAAGHEAHSVITDGPEMKAEAGPDISFSDMVHDSHSSLRRAWARRFFLHCDKPVGVYTQSTVWASDIIEGCRDAHIPVPEQVAVISMADLADEGKAWPVPLTVLTPDYEEQGYQAALLLDRMMKGERVSPHMIIKIPPQILVPRDSTLCYATDNLPVTKATAFIMRNLHDPELCVKQVQHAAQEPRSTFYRDFRRQFKMSVARYIESLRLKEALLLLETTASSATAIATHCGFGDLRRFRHSLVRAKCMGPTEWREKNEAGKLGCAEAGRSRGSKTEKVRLATRQVPTGRRKMGDG